MENGNKWRSLGKNWHTIYTRANRWAKNNVLEKIFIYLQKQGMISLNKRILCLDSTCIKVHPDSHGALKKMGKQAIGKTKGGLNTKIHMICTDENNPVIFSLSPGNAGMLHVAENLSKNSENKKSKDICSWIRRMKAMTLDF